MTHWQMPVADPAWTVREGGGGGGGGGLIRRRSRPWKDAEGGHPSRPARPGGMGERCKLPQTPRSQRFMRWKTLQNYAKKITDPAITSNARCANH